jgi:hypothetical protein
MGLQVCLTLLQYMELLVSFTSRPPCPCAKSPWKYCVGRTERRSLLDPKNEGTVISQNAGTLYPVTQCNVTSLEFSSTDMSERLL